MKDDLLEIINRNLLEKDSKNFNVGTAVDLCEKTKDFLTGLVICFYYSIHNSFNVFTQKEKIDICEKFKLNERISFFKQKVLEEFDSDCDFFLKNERKLIESLAPEQFNDYFCALEKTAERLGFVELFGFSRIIYENVLLLHEKFSKSDFFNNKSNNKKIKLDEKIKGLNILENYSKNDFAELLKVQDKISKKHLIYGKFKSIVDNFDVWFSDFIKKFKKNRIFNEDFCENYERLCESKDKIKENIKKRVLHDEYMSVLFDDVVDDNKFSELLKDYRINHESIFSLLFFAEDFKNAEIIFPYVDKNKKLFLLTNHSQIKPFCIFEKEFTKWFAYKINRVYESGLKDFAKNLTTYISEKNNSYLCYQLPFEELKKEFKYQELKDIVCKYLNKEN